LPYSLKAIKIHAEINNNFNYMQCPRCSSSKTRVVDSREGAEGRSVRRRRECESCEFRFTTFERIEESLPLVVKKGGQRESFDRYKVLSGLKKACEKRPVSLEKMEEIVKGIEADLLESAETEVASQVIGEMVIERLHDIDQVSYVRFASVYREFSDIEEFMDTLRQLVSTSEMPSLSKIKERQSSYSEKLLKNKQKQQKLALNDKG
jgi:transcriptional repressor NrdR